MKRYVYADNAATTRLSMKAYEAMKPYLLNEYGNASQPYSFARSSKKALKNSREIIARCIGALPEEIYFTSCGTESDNWVICGAAKRNMSIVTSSIEHHAILRPCEDVQRVNGNVQFLPVSEDGLVSVEDAKRSMQNSCGILSVMFANNEIGTIQPIKNLAKAAHQKGWLFHTDAVQAVGHVPIDVHELGVDMLSASAHKFNGPKGIGFLYIKKGIELPPLINGGMQESGYRAGTENVASVVGMASALEENVRVIGDTNLYLQNLETRLLDGMRHQGLIFKRNGALSHIFGNLSLSFAGQNGETLLHRLDLNGVFVSTGSACDSRRTQVSHVLKAIGLEGSLAKGTIRISLGRYNNTDDVEYLVECLGKIVLDNKLKA